MALLLVPGAVAVLLYLYGLWAARRELRAFVQVLPQPLRTPLLVVVPARNEAKGIGACLDAVLAEPSTDLTVVVVDDRSSDDTAAIVAARAAQDARVVLVMSDVDPPPGLFGKPLALQRGVAASRARGLAPERILFLDADVVVGKGALGGLVEALDRSQGDALSGLPRLVVGSAIEAMLVPAFVSLVGGRAPPSRVHAQGDAAAFLNGQVLLVRAQALDDVGGFGAVASTVLEDVALAVRLKAAGKALRLADLRAVCATRMYASWSSLREGFGKNAVPALGGPRATVTTAIGALLLTLLAPSAAIAATIWAPREVAVGAWALWMCGAGAQGRLRRGMGVPAWPALIAPVVYALVAYVLLHAVRRTSVTWKGRTYPRG